MAALQLPPIATADRSLKFTGLAKQANRTRDSAHNLNSTRLAKPSHLFGNADVRNPKSLYPCRTISRSPTGSKVSDSSAIRVRASSLSRLKGTTSPQAATSAQKDTSAWPEPPVLGFDYRKATAETTYSIVAERYPDLMDLVRRGVLVVVQQPVEDDEAGAGTDTSSSRRLPREIFILGTTHVSETAGEDAMRVVRSVQPQNVVVELCKSRAPIMYDPVPDPNQLSVPSSDATGAAAAPARDLFLMGGASLPQTLMRSIQLGGQSSLLLRLLLSFVSRRSAQAVGVQPGHEFRAAREAADAIGAQMVLGDRPIEITLRRAWKALSLLDRARLASALLQGGLKGGSLEQSELKGAFSRQRDSTNGQGMEGLNMDRDVVGSGGVVEKDDAEGEEEVEFLSAVFQEVARQFPTLIGPLVHERDAYLAWALKRSKAVRGCDRVVGVVGRGHLPGVVHYLLQDNEQRTLRFKQLIGASASDEKELGKGGMAVRVAKRVGLEVAVGLGLWWAFTLIS